MIENDLKTEQISVNDFSRLFLLFESNLHIGLTFDQWCQRRTNVTTISFNNSSSIWPDEYQFIEKIDDQRRNESIWKDRHADILLFKRDIFPHKFYQNKFTFQMNVVKQNFVQIFFPFSINEYLLVFIREK